MRADVRALESGTRLKDVFFLEKVTDEFPAVPVVLLLYFNSIFVYGIERFFAACEEAGISGVIVPDLPLEEQDEARPAADAHGIYMIAMVTPTSGDRLQKITASAKGFLYCVALSASRVSGARSQPTSVSTSRP